MTAHTEALRARLSAESEMHASRGDGHLAGLLDAAAAALAQQPSAPSAEPAALLVRDIAADLQVSALDVCNALRLFGYGHHSVNMAITADMARKLTQHFGAAPQQTAPQAGVVGAPDPIGYMSPQQISLIADNCAEGGAYIPIRKTSAGNFTLGLYVTPEAAHAAPVPTVQPLTDAQLNAISRADHGGSDPQEWFCNAIRATESACAAAWGITLAATPAPTPEAP